MPNPITNLEINDVLSSIRRLVSGDKTEMKKTDKPESARFVLTPAHRIDAGAAQHDPLPDLTLSRARSDDQPPKSSEHGQAADVTPDQQAGPSGRLHLGDSAEPDAWMTSLPGEAAASRAVEIPDTSGDAEPTAEPTVGPAAPPPATTLEDRIAELEEAVGRSGDEWEPDGSEPDTDQLPKRHLFEVVDNTSQWQDEMDSAAPDGEKPGQADRRDDAKPRKAPLQLAEVATFSHMPRLTDPVPVPDPKPDPVPSATEPEPDAEPLVALPIFGSARRDHEMLPNSDVPESDVPESDVAELDVPESDVTEFDHGGPARRPVSEVIDGDDDVFVDEDVLRRLVTEIVREELQGRLGERITKNVRRMVRREIEQTLTLRDFE